MSQLRRLFSASALRRLAPTAGLVLFFLGGTASAQTLRNPPPAAAAPGQSWKDATYGTFCWIPPGRFLMGSKVGNDALPIHQVTISKGFWMGRYDVTQAQWEAVMASNPSFFKGPDRPVEHVSWDDCQMFIARLNAQGQGRFRLPTEAEWEYACRAGTTGFRYGPITAIVWTAYYFHRLNATHPVGELKPNDWGLYDMNGNVNQWCQDWYGPYPEGPATDPQGPPSGSGRVYRGGSWDYDADTVHSAARDWSEPDSRNDYIGLRLVRSLPEPGPVPSPAGH